MFDVTESIEDGYLWNFSSHEQALFRQQHQSRQWKFNRYHQKLVEMTVANSPAIFANDEPCPSTPLEIKYTFNRIHMNDPRETELTLNSVDPPGPQKASYAQVIPWAFEDNTYCRTVILNGVQTREGWHKRGFNDLEAAQILDALSDKKLTEFTFASYPLLSDRTYQKISDTLNRPGNQWGHVTLGKIVVDPKIADSLQKTGKVSFTRLIKPAKSEYKSFLSLLFNRERNT